MSTRLSYYERNIWSWTTWQVYQFAYELVVHVKVCFVVIFVLRYLDCRTAFYWNYVCITVSKSFFDDKFLNKYWFAKLHGSWYIILLNLPSDNSFDFSEDFFIIFLWKKLLQHLEYAYCICYLQKIIYVYTHYTGLALQTPNKNAEIFI